MNSRPYLFFTIDVEEWFTSTKILSLDAHHSYREKSDIVETTEWIFDLLEREGMHGTFFFISEIAERFPHLIERMKRSGHEVALHGETHDSLHTLSSETFFSMLLRMKKLFQEKFQIPLRGYRAPYFSIHAQALADLQKAGFCYDSSVMPSLPIPGWYGSLKAPLTPYTVGKELDQKDSQSHFLEFPISVHPLLRIPALGGYYFRNLGFTWTQHILRQSLQRLGYAMLYLHPWELSPNLPKIPGMPFYMRRRTGVWAREALERLLKNAKNLYNPQTLTLYDYSTKL